MGAGGGLGVVLATVSVACVAAVACGDVTSTTDGAGNTVINDTRDAEARAPANPDDGAAPTGQPDAYAGGDGYAPGAGDAAYDVAVVSYGNDSAAYPGVAECSSCACPAAGAYCFGGATPRKDPMLLTPEGAVDAGPPCPMVAAGALGCTPLPSGAADCPSLLATLQPTYSCYLVCANDGTTMTVYCPNQ